MFSARIDMVNVYQISTMDARVNDKTEALDS
jgi:hypothetical protein